ncbi:30S ribosomal protein S17e [Candidatus Pacearchaeota archaeon]|nr:MAG: 30S ribosomal protein S17e [Candidatus Pacearchaeota archaeon]
MGRIRSALIKRLARQLYEKGDGFNEDFENNKKLLKEVFQYKKLRNKVAGAIVALARQAKNN